MRQLSFAVLLRLASVACGASVAIASGACTLDEQGQKPAAAPSLIKTGNAKYDDFFGAVRDVREQARAAPADADGGHAELVKALGLDAKAKGAATIEASGARAKKLQDKGVLLHLEIAPEPRVVAVRGKVEVGAEGEALFKVMESTIKASLDVRKKLAGVAAHAVELDKRCAELVEQVPDAFKDDSPAKREEVIAQLGIAKTMLAEAADGATRAAGAESRFVVDLVYAVETGGGTRVDPPTKTARGRGPGAPASRGSAPAPPPASPSPPPKKKPKGSGDDFEP